MTLGEYWDSLAEEVREEDIAIWISTLQELHVSRDNARNMLIEKYSDFSEKADKLFEKYWK